MYIQPISNSFPSFPSFDAGFFWDARKAADSWAHPAPDYRWVSVSVQWYVRLLCVVLWIDILIYLNPRYSLLLSRMGEHISMACIFIITTFTFLPQGSTSPSTILRCFSCLLSAPSIIALRVTDGCLANSVGIIFMHRMGQILLYATILSSWPRLCCMAARALLAFRCLFVQLFMQE